MWGCLRAPLKTSLWVWTQSRATIRRDPASVHQDNPAYAARLDANVKGLRVGVLRPFLEGVNPAVKASSFESAFKVFAGAGCEIVDVDVPELSYAAMTSMLTSSAESAGINRRWFRERHQDYVPHVSRGIAVGMTITASEYLTAQRARHQIREACARPMRKSTSSPRRRPPGSRRSLSDGVKGNGDDTRHASYNHSNLLRFPSMLGLPGCSLAVWNQSGKHADRHATHWRLVRRSNRSEYRASLSEHDRLAHAAALASRRLATVKFFGRTTLRGPRTDHRQRLLTICAGETAAPSPARIGTHLGLT